MRIIFCCIIFFLVIGLSEHSMAEIKFEDVTNDVGISYNGSTWGASWGDINGDGWADLWTNGHRGSLTLYENNHDGTFREISIQPSHNVSSIKDIHGASWADFDNDGDQDLIVLTGSQRGVGHGPNGLFVNKNGSLYEMASELGLDYPLGRGRTPLWYDVNNDGLLDVMLNNSPRPDKLAPTALFLQTLDGFSEFTNGSGLKFSTHVSSAQISDLNRDGKMELVFMNPFSQGIYDISMSPFNNIQDELLVPKMWYSDTVLADINGDLHSDIILVGKAAAVSLAEKDGTNKIKSTFVLTDDEHGFNFETLGEVTFDIYIQVPQDLKVFIGSEGVVKPENKFTLSSEDPNSLGILNHKSGKDSGIYIGYDKNNNIWNVLQSSSEHSESNIIIESQTKISNLNYLKSSPKQQFKEDKIFINTEKGFEDATSSWNLINPTSCRSVSAGDFDNDMDIDLYLVCTLEVKNIPNLLYLNQGNGTFIEVSSSAGVVGSLLGIGDTATTVDFDNDGFLDIFVTNGHGGIPYAKNGTNQLFRNIGNQNHWIEIDLIGTKSNRDGIGAKIITTAGGVSQLREQSGGMHDKAQNHQRIHFGLGNNTLVDRIVVYWPSGIVHELKNINVDQIIQISEPLQPLSPKKQIMLNVNPKNVFCGEGRALAFKYNNDVACIYSDSFIPLKERGWLRN